MFAGIVERSAAVERFTQSGEGTARLALGLGDLLDALPHGASVAVSGVCLTLANAHDGIGEFDVVPETLRKTTLGRLRPGDRVNVERSLRVGDRIDGHFVQGHVDGVGEVVRVERASDWRVWIAASADLAACIVRKGSITVDGVSLTIADVSRDGSFCVALIPTTLERTTLGGLTPGDQVNLETDILARLIVARLDRLMPDGPDADEQFAARLRAAGWAP